MQRNNVQDDLQEGFEPGPLPPIGPDGAPELVPQRRHVVPPPRLCEAGPCRNYHRFEIQLDVTRPVAERLEENGQLVGAPPPMPFHVRVHHYCYPNQGIETDLGDLPVLSCNRWEPKIATEIVTEAARLDAFMASDDGRAYKTALDAWRDEQQSNTDVAVAASTEGDPT